MEAGQIVPIDATVELLRWFFGIIIPVVLSYFVSKKVAASQISQEQEIRREQERKQWYRKANRIASRVHAQWYRLMNSAEVSKEYYFMKITSEFIQDLEDHAADGRTLDVDKEAVNYLESAAAELALSQTIDPDDPNQSQHSYYEIENELIKNVERVMAIAERETEGEVSDEMNTVMDTFHRKDGSKTETDGEKKDNKSDSNETGQGREKTK